MADVRWGIALAFLVAALFAPVPALSPEFLALNDSNADLHLLGLDENLVNASEVKPSAANPITFAFVKVVDAFPSIEGLEGEYISSREGAALVWAWGAGSFEGTIDESDAAGCTGSRYSFAKAGNPGIEAEADIIAGSLDGNESIAKTILLDGKENFLRMFDAVGENFSGEERLDELNVSVLEKWGNATSNTATNSTAVYPKLIVTISGTVVFPYRVTEETYRLACTKNECECLRTTMSYLKNFSLDVGDEKNYSIETRNQTFFLIRPVLYEQIDYRPDFDFLLLGNRELARIEVIQNNESIGSAAFLSFYNYTDALGYAHLGAKMVDAEETLTRSSLPTSAYEYYTLQKTISPVPFARQLFANASMKETLGKNYMEAIATDRFGREFESQAIVRNRMPGTVALPQSKHGKNVLAGNDTIRGAVAEK